MSELVRLSAREALDLFRRRALSPVELTEALIAQAEAVEPRINAFTYRYFEEALQAAQVAEQRYGIGEARALEGLCVAIKDSGHIAGQPTSAGSLLSDDAPQPATSPINQRVLDAGGIVHARSATPEYSCAAVTWSRRWGVTRNPWNPEMTPGGSSGGAAASLAAGTSSLATGSDIGGSIRIPAACCGVVGYKPPRGRNPVDTPFNLDFFCHTGPLARTVGDTLLFQNVLCGPHANDPVILPRHEIRATGDVRGLRIAVSRTLGFFNVDPEVNAAVGQAAEVFRDLGAEVLEVEVPWGPQVMDAALTHLRMIFGTSIAPSTPAEWERLTPYARAFAEAGLNVTPRSYLEAISQMGEMAQQFADAMAGFDLLICPTNALPAVPATFDPGTETLRINGTPVDPMLGWVMTVPFNILSTRPVLSVPCGRAKNNVPIGLQIVGRPFDDDTVFRAALAFEAALAV
ncbi:MAG: amidase [Shimia sp.]